MFEKEFQRLLHDANCWRKLKEIVDTEYLKILLLMIEQVVYAYEEKEKLKMKELSRKS